MLRMSHFKPFLPILAITMAVLSLSIPAHATCVGEHASQRSVFVDIASDDLVYCNSGVYVSATVSGGGGGATDNIVSGTTSVYANGTGYISFTTGGTTTGYFDTAGRLVVPGISVTTAQTSVTSLYASGVMGLGLTNPTASRLDIYRTFTALSNPTDAVAYIHANTMDNLGSSADPVLLRLYGSYLGVPKGRLFSAENSENVFELVNSKVAFAKLYSGTFSHPVAGTAYGPKPMLSISYDGTLADGYTPLLGVGVNLNVTSWGGGT